MKASALTFMLIGLEAHPIRVEVEAAPGLAVFQLVGLAEASVRESRVRVRAALQQLGVDLSEHTVTVTLHADVKVSGGGFDLAIALATLGALGKVPPDALQGVAFLGELSLTGAVRPVRGVLPVVCVARTTGGISRIIVPRDNASEAASTTLAGNATPNHRVSVAGHLREIVDHFAKGAPLDGPGMPLLFVPEGTPAGLDMSDVRGQANARRALEIAASGAHNLIFMGPPGAGKTMLARRLPTIMPPMSIEEALDVTAIHSVAGLLNAERGVLVARPFRAPHHTVSAAGLVGGGDPVRPGEVSLAHRGILFLDELVEFKASVLESLRQPLEDGFAALSRGGVKITFPARPLLVGAVNPCPCGYAGERSTRCSCAPERVRAYRARLSGPLLDRIDLHVVLPPVDVAHLQSSAEGEPSAAVRERVIAARVVQGDRAALGVVSRKRAEMPDAAGKRVLTVAVKKLALPEGVERVARKKILRVARTIADLDGSDGVRAKHVAEALGLVLPAYVWGQS